MVHQHFMLVDTLSVVENVMLGAEGGRLLAGGEAKVRAELARFAEDYGLTIDPDALIGDLSVGLQQRVEIIKALYRGAEILHPRRAHRRAHPATRRKACSSCSRTRGGGG